MGEHGVDDVNGCMSLVHVKAGSGVFRQQLWVYRSRDAARFVEEVQACGELKFPDDFQTFEKRASCLRGIRVGFSAGNP
jgi:hypothetical protein